MEALAIELISIFTSTFHSRIKSPFRSPGSDGFGPIITISSFNNVRLSKAIAAICELEV